MQNNGEIQLVGSKEEINKKKKKKKKNVKIKNKTPRANKSP